MAAGWWMRSRFLTRGKNTFGSRRESRWYRLMAGKKKSNLKRHAGENHRLGFSVFFRPRDRTIGQHHRRSRTSNGTREWRWYVKLLDSGTEDLDLGLVFLAIFFPKCYRSISGVIKIGKNSRPHISSLGIDLIFFIPKYVCYFNSHSSNSNRDYKLVLKKKLKIYSLEK